MPRSLARLVEDFALEAHGRMEGVEVTGVAVDPADARSGDLYLDLGRGGAAEAVERGAVAVLTDAQGAEGGAELEVPVLVTPDPRGAAGDVAAWVHRTAEHPPLLFAVTGTHGKTSVVHLLDAILRQLGVVTGFSSTAERRAGDEVLLCRAEPEAAELHALLARLREGGARAAAIEVSAQALSEGKVGGLEFDVVGFTNLSEDHLEDYPDMEAYLAAKQSLFDPDRARRGVVDIDGEWGRRLADESHIPVTTLATTPGAGDWTVTVGAVDRFGSAFTLEGPGGSTISTHVPLVGPVMATNAALAIVMLVESGFELEAIGHALERDGGIVVTIPGRAERISGDASPSVYLDDAPGAGALRTTLEALRSATPGRLLVVLPVGPGRNAEALGTVAAEAADVLVLTDFPPGSARLPAAREAARRSASTAELHEIDDPRQALRLAISLAEPADSVLWAGPGSEHQENPDVKHPYSVSDDARLALQEAGWSVAS